MKSLLNSTSVKTRFFASAVANVVRALLGFGTGLLIARSLGPSNYGDMAFALGVCSAVLSLFNLGSLDAFFTFISRRARGYVFYGAYLLWSISQLFIVLLLVIWIPDILVDKIWVGLDHDLVLVAILTIFMQQQVWQSVNKIGESMRMTVKVQCLNVAISFVYLAAVSLLVVLDYVSVLKVMMLMIIQYVIGVIFAYYLLGGHRTICMEENVTVKEVVNNFFGYCKPLIILSIAVFVYNFTDKWLLQIYGGSVQQGYFQIASQFSIISLLATTSILSVFWKEIAKSWEDNDSARVKRLYVKVSRGLVFLAAIISGLLMPWAEQIVTLLLGVSYSPAWPVLALMLLYPIHQSMGQIGGTMLLARGQTKIHMFLTVGAILVSLPLTYILLAPQTGFGLEMGAMGIALKMLLLGVITVNIQAFVIARLNGWKFDWLYQVIGIPLMLSFGLMVKVFVGLFWNLKDINWLNLYVPMLIDCFIYITLVLLIVWFQPWLAGLEKNDIRSAIMKLKHNK